MLDQTTLLSIFEGLVANLGLSAILILFYNRIAGTRERLWRGLSLGVAFGVTTLLATVEPLRLAPGIIFHIGPALVALAGFIGGWPAGLIAAAVGVGSRVYVGGVGMPAGSTNFVASALIGILLHAYYRRRARPADTTGLLVVSAFMIPAGLSTLAMLPGDAGWIVFKRIGAAYAVAQLAAVMLVGGFMLETQRRLRLAGALAASERRSAAILESVPNALIIADKAGRIQAVNAQAERWFQYTRKELIGKPVEILVPEALRAGHPKHREAYMAHPALRPMGTRGSLRARRKDGSEFPVDIQLNSVPGGPPQVIASIADMTDAKAQEAALRLSEERLRITLNNAPGIVFRRRLVKGESPQYVFFGGRMLDTWGLQGSEVIQDPQLLLKFIHPEDLPLLLSTLDPQKDDLQPRSLLHRLITPFGEVRWVQIESRAQLMDDGSVVRDGIMVDVTEREHAKAKLKDSEQRYRLLAETIGDQILLLGKDGRVLYTSPSAKHISGYEDAERIGRDGMELVHPEDVHKVQEMLRQVRGHGETCSVVYRIRHKSGRWAWVEAIGRPYAAAGAAQDQDVVIVVRNIDERRALEEQLRQSQRMEAVGQLTGGVAHEFNNLLMVISGNMEILRSQVDGDGPTGKLVDAVSNAVRRGAGLTKDLLAFSRKQPLQPSAVSVTEVLRNFERLARGVLTESITLDFTLGTEPIIASADVNQLQNAILNLIVNARDAMGHSGTIGVKTRVRQVDAAEAKRMEVGPGRYVEISVSDTGTGMAPDVLARAIEPFFTTKEVGQGTGLGLSMVHGFTRQSGGFLFIESEVGKGTTVHICLPATAAESAMALEETALPAPTPQAWRRVVLLVEDDPGVLMAVARMLNMLGYQVLTAHDGPSAIALLREHEQVDILLTDVVMPNGMSGLDIARAAKTRFANIRVVFMSGYNENVIIHNGAVDPGVVLLWKPFQKEDLQRTLAEVMSVPEDKPETHQA